MKPHLFLQRAKRALGVRGEVGLAFLDDAAIQRLNRRYRRHDRPTDVLSFPSNADGCLGDLAISLDAARRQARRRRHSLEAEVKILLLHGLLHLCGWDHEADAGDMRRLERRLRLALGLPPGLLERRQNGKRG